MSTKSKITRRLKIKKRVSSKIHGTVERPRMVVYKSNKEIYVQLINDDNATTLTSASSREKELAGQKTTKTEKASLVGKRIAEKAKTAGYSNVVFDRNGYLYHGRIKQLADAAREGGLEF
jgi:large subunit ribosomal protein L18